MNLHFFTCKHIVPSQVSTLAHSIYPIGICWVWRYIKPISTPKALPLVISNTGIYPAIGRPSPATVILHATHYVVRKFVIYINMVKLANRQLLIKLPATASVSANPNAPIIAINYKIGVVWVYPKCMVIRVYAAVWNDNFKIFSSIFTHRNHLVNIIQPVFIFWINPYILKIKRSVVYIAAVTVYEFPFKPAIISAVQAVFL